MSRQVHGSTTPDQRDQAADDRDEAAWQRDRASALRDRDADDRDEHVQARLNAALKYAGLTRRLLDAAAAEHPEPDQRIARDLLRHLQEALSDAGRYRRASAHDRQAAAADRAEAAEDRAIEAGHRGQAAIERAQQPAAGMAAISGERWADLYERARSARSRAGALGE